jgi:O-antigen ligase
MNATLRILYQRFYVKELLVLFLAFFLAQGIFSWIFIRNSVIIEGYTKLLGIFSFGFLIYRYNQLNRGEKAILILFSLLLLKLVLESLWNYDSFFRQLTMYTVLAPVAYVLFIKFILRKMQLDLLPFMARFCLVVYVVFMLLFGRGFSFSLELVEMEDYGPFSGDSRIIHASQIFIIIVPFLWYLHQFATTRKLTPLLLFLFCFTIILVHQHRSVWSSTLMALCFYFFAGLRNRLQKLSTLGNLFITGSVLLMIAVFFVANLFPGFLDFLSERFVEIWNPSKEGSTGNFRIQQREVYFELFLERPLFGWTFEGFEMPNPLVDWWPAMSGQHFHEGYMEMLFYHGIVGLVFKYGFLVYLFIKIFSKKLNAESVILASFCISALVFSFNYVLPLSFWAFVGMALYYIERDIHQSDEEVLEDGEESFTPYIFVESK